MVLDRHETILAQPFMWALLDALAPQTEQVSPLPRVTPPVPEHVVVGDVNKEDVSHLSPLIFCKIPSVHWSVLFSIFGEGQGFFLSYIDGLHINFCRCVR